MFWRVAKYALRSSLNSKTSTTNSAKPELISSIVGMSAGSMTVAPAALIAATASSKTGSVLSLKPVTPARATPIRAPRRPFGSRNCV